MGIKNLEEKLKTAKANPTWHCRFHPTDWFHEVGCPHVAWTPEQLQEALQSSKAMERVYQHELFGTSLDGRPTASYDPPPNPNDMRV